MATDIEVWINEVLPSPQGKDNLNEWIELKNPGVEAADISRWQIKDAVGSTRAYVFPAGTQIPGHGFLVLTRPISKITLNNDGDGLFLIRADASLADQVNYAKAPEGQSFNRTAQGWVWSRVLTPGAENVVSLAKKTTASRSAQNPTPRAVASSSPIFPAPASLTETGLSAARPADFLGIFSLALIIAFLSAAAVFFLKRRK